MKQIIMIFIAVLIAGQCFAISSSTSYKITSDVIDLGSAVSSSTSFKVIGKLRTKEIANATGASIIVKEGFLRSSYFSSQVPVLAPIVTALTPSTGINTGTIGITDLAGANFQSGATVKLSKSGQSDISATDVVVVSSSKITCTFDLTGKDGGLWSVTVTNPDGRSGTLPSAFTVAFPAPTIISITPNQGINNASINITDLAGTNFRSGAAIKLLKVGESDIIGSNIVVESSTKITCSFNLINKAVGLWDIVVANDDNKSGTLTGGFKIEAPTVQIIGQVISSQNPYNPAVGATSINYTLSKDTDVTINIFNMRGEKVWQRVYPAGQTGSQAGLNQVIWNGMTDFQSTVSFGVYFVQITTKSNGNIIELGRTKIAVTK